MYKNLQNKTFVFFILIGVFVVSHSFSQKFEGTFKMTKESLGDTITYKYYVKADKIRIEEFETDGNLTNITLIDLKSSSIKLLNPYKKVFRPLPTRPYKEEKDNDLQIIKSENSKVINNLACTQWRVRNEKKNSEITYWVVKDGFEFFARLLQIYYNLEKHEQYYLQVPGCQSFLPMSCNERTLLRVNRMKIDITEFKNTTIDDNLFAVPADYNIFVR